MKLERKTVGATITKADDDGTFEATIATIGEIDKDGDIVEPGAFGPRPMSVLPAHDDTHVPMGKATIEERGVLAVAVGQFNMDIQAAREWHSSLKFDLERPPAVQEWSWGYRVVKARGDTVDGVQVRRLIDIDMREVSPVLRGASVGTGTLEAKAERLSDTDLRERLQSSIDHAEKGAEYVWVEAVYPDVVVYTIRKESTPSRTFERGYKADSGGAVTLGDERREVVRQVIYQAVGKGAKLALVDQMRFATLDVESLLLKLEDVAAGRKDRDRKLGVDVRRITVETGEKCSALVAQIAGIIERDILPEDAVAKAAARWMASEALRAGVATG